MTPEEQAASQDSETLAQLNQLHKGEQPNLDPEQQLSEDSEDSNAQFSEEPIVIDGQTFNSTKEAYEYSQKKLAESETERLIMQAKQEAYQEAMSMGQSREQAYATSEQITAPPEEDMDEFYNNPSEYMKNTRQKIRDEVFKEVKQSLTQEEQDRETWREFFQAHPDLDGFKQDCELVLNQNLDTIKLLAAKDRKKAMDYLATKTREKFQNYMERLKPQQVLHNTHSGPSVGGNPTTSVTPTQKNDEPLDLISQMRSLRNR